ncbi:MAG: DUF6141 family protein [Methanomicrobiales archaeon]|nr:DUF6141 family protein [Methanomicrobiales archaeon]
MSDEVYYQEKQSFRQLLLWAFLLAIAIISWYALLSSLLLSIPIGTKPAPLEVSLLICAVFGVLFPIFFVFLTLEVEVTSSSLTYRFFPLHLTVRRIPWSEVVDARALTYHPIREYGGWGIRIGAGWKRAYNVSGDKGVIFTLKNGRSVLFGSQSPEEFLKSVERARSGR